MVKPANPEALVRPRQPASSPEKGDGAAEPAREPRGHSTRADAADAERDAAYRQNLLGRGATVPSGTVAAAFQSDADQQEFFREAADKYQLPQTLPEDHVVRDPDEKAPIYRPNGKLYDQPYAVYMEALTAVKYHGFIPHDTEAAHAQSAAKKNRDAGYTDIGPPSLAEREADPSMSGLELEPGLQGTLEDAAGHAAGCCR
ncbi:hypothetical protein WJX72_012354 [[Myrmecia] bisecta]|uniref:Uncharacterized protein n=1 Tax=[Myrmecia] bisecta TaxID=41462 RepID=A0AAW1PBA5_9CHLO